MARSLDSRNSVVLRAIDFADLEGRLEEDVFGHFEDNVEEVFEALAQCK